MKGALGVYPRQSAAAMQALGPIEDLANCYFVVESLPEAIGA
jgi:hypothetical protein